jgi:hypothetical protein
MSSLSARQSVVVSDFADVFVQGPGDSAVTSIANDRQCSRGSIWSRPSRRSVLFVVAGALAGLLVGTNIIAASVLEVLLRGISNDVLYVPGVLSASWALNDGVALTLAPGAPLLLAAATIVGATVAWAGLRRRSR